MSLVMLAFLVSAGGCGQETLATNEEASHFISVVAHGSDPSDWKLADDASVVAVSAWENQSEIERLGQRLREEAPEWVCDTAERVEKASQIIYGLGLDQRERAEIISDANVQLYEVGEVESLIDELTNLGTFEATKTVDSVCGALKQF